MRNELENIERIERYLEGQMDEGEQQAFEEEMEKDPQLQREVQVQQQLQEGVMRQALRSEIQQAHQRFVNGGGGSNFFTSAKFLAYLAGVVVITAVGIWLSSENSPFNRLEGPFETAATPTLADTFDAAIPSQYFKVNPKENQVVTGEDGTRIYIPKGAFLNAEGRPEERNLQLELKEGLGTDDMILGNLTTLDADSNLLESGGMVYLKARDRKGKELTINPDKPLYIEIPTEERKPGMQVYQGFRGNNGNLIWALKKKPENYLVAVPFEELNFYPPGFEDAVVAGLPYRGHTEATGELKDSLYYSLKYQLHISVSDKFDLVYSDPENADYEVVIDKPNSTTQPDADLDMNEAYYRGNQLENGEYTDASFNPQDEATGDSAVSYATEDATEYGVAEMCLHINPLVIKTIRQPQYENSFLATREFEERLQAIFSTCSDEFIALYVQNLDKDLWISDSIAAVSYGQFLRSSNSERANPFFAFAAQKLTHVKGAELYADMLKETYQKDLARFNREIREAEEAYQKELKKAEVEIEKVKEKYRKVLVKREAKRMTTYGFEWTETGWLNVDRGTIPKPTPKPIEVKLRATSPPDRSYVYFSFTSIKSIYRLNYDAAKDLYYPGSASNHYMDMPDEGAFTVVAVSYYGDAMRLDTLVRPVSFGGNLKLSPQAMELSAVRKLLRSLSGSGKSNDLSTDLGYQKQLYQEKLRREKLRKEEQFIQTLREVAFPCCYQSRIADTNSYNLLYENVKHPYETAEGITLVDENGQEKIILKKDQPQLFNQLLKKSDQKKTEGHPVPDIWGPRKRKPEDDQH